MQTSPTEQPCVWGRPSVTNESVLVRDLKPPKPQENEDAAHPSNFPSFTRQLTPDEVRSRMRDLLRGTDALMRTVLEPPPLPPPVQTPLQLPSMKQLASQCATVESFLQLLQETYTEEVCKDIVAATVKQSLSPTWKQHRTGRLTASMFYAAATYKGHELFNSVVKTVLNMYGSFSSDAMLHGLSAEDSARQQYAVRHAEYHPEVEVVETGLHISPEYAYLGASPDGLVKCVKCGLGVIEIKSPYKYRDAPWEQAAKDTSYGCILNNGNLQLKRHSRWMYQVQGQMLLTGTTYCDFILNAKTMMATRIYRDNDLLAEMLSALTNFYKVFIFPALTHWGRHQMAVILQTTFSNAFFKWKFMNFAYHFTEMFS